MIADMGPLQKLSDEELLELEQSNNKEKFFISGYSDYASKHLVLFRGDGKCFVVPFDSFRASSIAPDFTKLSIIDYGLTIKLGDYEAASDTIQDELDL